MQLRKATVVFGVIAVGAVAALVGQSLAAQGAAPARSGKTLYAGVFPHFVENLTATVNTPKTLIKVTVRAPSSGHAVVTIDSQIWTDFPSTAGNELVNVIDIARCKSANNLHPHQCAGESSYWFHKPQNQTSDDSTYPYSVTAQLNFRRAGRQTLFLNASASNFPGGLWGDNSAHVQVTFTPNHAISVRSRVTVAAATPGSA
jgi:hypothetical protein